MFDKWLNSSLPYFLYLQSTLYLYLYLPFTSPTSTYPLPLQFSPYLSCSLLPETQFSLWKAPW